MNSFRLKSPTRTCKKVYKNYRSYKRFLINDFSGRCGYCDGSDTWLGGHRSYHIDHFAPKDKFADLETEYDNLIYACPSCNLSKSNKWPSTKSDENIVDEKGFLHPCKDDFNGHFHRDEEGRIIGISNVAKDMAVSLNLGLQRHAIIWKLGLLENLISDYRIELSKALAQETRIRLENIHYKLLKIFYQYHTELRTIVNA
jgi:uncharacterized protein (TIGR02646 family)